MRHPCTTRPFITPEQGTAEHRKRDIGGPDITTIYLGSLGGGRIAVFAVVCRRRALGAFAIVRAVNDRAPDPRALIKKYFPLSLRHDWLAVKVSGDVCRRPVKLKEH